MISSPLTLQTLLNYASQDNKYVTIMTQAAKLINLKGMALDTFSPDKVSQVISEMTKSYSARTQFQNNYSPWGHFEYKAFVWISICLANMANKEISQFDDQDLTFLMNVFSDKDKVFLLYHLRGLCQKGKWKNVWNDEENKLLVQIMSDCGQDPQWKQISYMMFVRSGCSIYKPRQKCREQWVNHLNPHLKRGQWSLEQDVLLFQYIVQHGKKWAIMSKLFKGRTEHMVKNRYNSIINKRKKKSHKATCQSLEKKILNDLEGNLKKKKMFEPDKTYISESGVKLTEEDILSQPQKQKVDRLLPDLMQEKSYHDDKLFLNWSFQSEDMKEFSLLEDNCFFIKEDILFPFQL